jgi:hypothetical protein
VKEIRLYPSVPESPDWGQIAWSFGAKQKTEALAMYNGLLKKERRKAVATLTSP